MPNFLIEQREKWDVIVTYNVDAASEAEARELTETGTHVYSDYQLINRDCQKIIDIQQAHFH